MSSLSLTDRSELATVLARTGWGQRATDASPTMAAVPGFSLVARGPAQAPPPSATGAATGPAEPVPFRPPAAELSGRLRALIEWLAQEVGGRFPFVADRDGLALAGERSENQDLIAIGSAMARLLQRIQDRAERAACSCLTLDVQGRTLQLVLVDSGLGSFMVGMLVDRPADSQARDAVDRALRAALRA